MISQIDFGTELILLREEAKSLQLVFQELGANRLEMQDGFLVAQSPPHRYMSELREEVTVSQDGKETKTYFDKITGNQVPSYYFMQDLPERYKDKDYVVCAQRQLVPLELAALRLQYPFRIVRTVSDTMQLEQTLYSLLAKIEEKSKMFQQLDDRLSQQYNERCQVAIGGGLVTTFNKVKLLEDCCTDLLQEHLDIGWKIVAACVQLEGRRPDYILGIYAPR